MSKISKAMIWSLGHSLSYADLSTKGKINWPVLLSECDEQGRFLADAKDYTRSICPIIDEITLEDVAELLSELEEHGMIIQYIGNSRALGQILKWWDYQNPTWARRSKYPPPEGWTDRVREKRGKEIIKINWDKDGGYSIEGNSIEQYRERMGIQSAYDDDGMNKAYSQLFTEVTGVLVATAIQAEEMDAWREDVSEQWFRDACKAAIDNNARKWAYVRAILERWKAEGRKGKRGTHRKLEAELAIYDEVAAERAAKSD